MSKRNSKRGKYLRAASRASAGLRDVIASKSTQAKQRRHDDRKLGTFGAASPVRILMKDGKRNDDADIDAGGATRRSDCIEKQKVLGKKLFSGRGPRSVGVR